MVKLNTQYLANLVIFVLKIFITITKFCVIPIKLYSEILIIEKMRKQLMLIIMYVPISDVC